MLRFKTATLTQIGLQRNGVWGEETAQQKIEHLGLMFGALAASPTGEVKGYGAPQGNLTFGLLIFPAVWDWYVQWRERRRGFYTAWEVDMLRIAIALMRRETGWVRQHPELLARVKPIAGLVTEGEIALANDDWHGACDRLVQHAGFRVREIARVARVHRDPFEPIMPILEADSPLGEYRKITEEIVRRMPCERRYPRPAAEAARAFLMLRLGLHLGLRQKNLRQLLVCPRGHTPLSERRLADLKRGELRWSDRDNGWEVLIPSVAFKNADSSFFGDKPFRLVLPDLGGLYERLEHYIARQRRILLGPADDPGTLFVKTVKVSSRDAAYDQTTFYEAWRLAIGRYGVFNPFTAAAPSGDCCRTDRTTCATCSPPTSSRRRDRSSRRATPSRTPPPWSPSTTAASCPGQGGAGRPHPQPGVGGGVKPLCLLRPTLDGPARSRGLKEKRSRRVGRCSFLTCRRDCG